MQAHLVDLLLFNSTIVTIPLIYSWCISKLEFDQDIFNRLEHCCLIVRVIVVLKSRKCLAQQTASTRPPADLLGFEQMETFSDIAAN